VWTSVTPNTCAAYAAVTGCANGGTPGDLAINFTAAQLGADAYYSPQPSSAVQYMPAGAGLANADFAVFVTAIQTSRLARDSTVLWLVCRFKLTSCRCGSGGSGILAYATTCQRDQYDRPTVS
jgi:hypothetical protein